MKRVVILLAAAAVCLGACAANKKPKPQSFVVNTEELGKEVMGYAGTTPLEIHVKDGRIEKIVALPNSETQLLPARAGQPDLLVPDRQDHRRSLRSPAGRRERSHLVFEGSD